MGLVKGLVRSVGLVLALACAAAEPTPAPPLPPSGFPTFTAEEKARLVGPVTLEAPRIEVDPGAVRMRLRGLVTVRGLVDADGRVQRLEAMKALPPAGTMERIAVGLQAARYRPAQLDGKPIPIGVVWDIEVDGPGRQVRVAEPRWPAL